MTLYAPERLKPAKLAFSRISSQKTQYFSTAGRLSQRSRPVIRGLATGQTSRTTGASNHRTILNDFKREQVVYLHFQHVGHQDHGVEVFVIQRMIWLI